MANRIYSLDSPLEKMTEGFMKGEKFSKDELYRQAQLDMQKAGQRREAEQFGIKDVSGYRSPKFDQSGNFAGYEENKENMARNRPPLQDLLPEYFKKEINPAKAPAPDPQVELDRQNNEINAKQEAENAAKRNAHLPEAYKNLSLEQKLPYGQRIPQSMDGNQPQQIKPLLASPEKKAADELIPLDAPAKEVAPGVKIQPTEQKANFANGLDVSAPVVPERMVAGSPAVNADYNPTPELMHDIQTRATTAAAKDTDPVIPVNSLPPNLREKIGIGPEFQGGIRASILKEMIQGSYRAAPKGEEPLLDETIGGIADIEKGAPLSSVMRTIIDKRHGEPLPKRDQYALEKAENRRRSASQFDAGMAYKADDKADKAVERFQKAYDKTGVLQALPYLQTLERITGGAVSSGKGNLSKLPGVGTNIARNIPLIGNAAGLITSKSYGGEEAYQAIQGLLNADIKLTTGAQVNKFEEGRILVKNGLGVGGSEKDVARGLKFMAEGLKEADESVRAAFDNSVVSTYQSRGGRLPFLNELAKGGGNKSAPAKSQTPAAKGPAKERNNYEEELQKSKELLTKYQESLMQNPDMPAVQVSSEVRKKKAAVDSFLKSKYGKGYRE